MNILLVEPQFPVPPKSKNHSHFLPLGLLKIASYHRAIGDKVFLHRGNYPAKVYPNQIKITSLFTYWSKYVWDSVSYYRGLYPKAYIQVGGIYASLMPEHAIKSGCNEVVQGLYMNGLAEYCEPAYDMVNVDYQIIHTSRGCFRKCSFCGTWKIEPFITYKKTIRQEIKKRKIVFYDNNLISNPFIKDILNELIEYKFTNPQRIVCESQSGIDGRILVNKPELAHLLKMAHFRNPRIAWDGPYKIWRKIKEQIDILHNAGYSSRDIFVFMLYNYDLSYSEMIEKLEKCRQWRVRVIDCRFRPLTSIQDNYNPRAKNQNEDEYYIHKGWNDFQIRDFRRRVRRQNIAIMLGLPNGRYVDGIEKKYMSL